MADRYDAVTAREYTNSNGETKTVWTKIGSAWPNRSGGFSITLDALPLPTMGERGLETRILLMEPKPRDDRQERQSNAGANAHRSHQPLNDLDDDLPF